MSRSAVSHFLWPPVIDSNYLDAARRRCLVILSIAAAFTGLISGLRNFEASFAMYPLQTAIAIIIPLIFLTCPLLIARTNNFRAIAIFYLTLAFVGMLMVPLMAGGMFSRATFFMLPWVVLVTLFLGWKEGIVAAVIVFTAYVALHLMHAAILPSVYDISADMISQWLLIGLSLTLLMLTVGAAIFQREMERAAVKLSEARVEADKANRAKSEFLAKMSHEIRTPMNGVLGMAEMLETTALTDQQKLYARTISASGQSLLTIINDILDLSKIEAGHISLESKPFALERFFEDIAALFLAQVERKGVAFVVDCEPSLPDAVCGDAGRIRQIVINLVGNALKFTDAGHIKIDVSGETRDDHVNLQIAVEDTGIGIPADKLEDVFDKFEQVESLTTRRFDGAGLGLAISRQLANAMGGALNVQSVYGEGCRFTLAVTLPIADVLPEEAIKETPPRAPAPNASRERLRVLVAEDNEVNRLVLQAMIDSNRCEIAFAINGQTAVNAFRKDDFDIVLMDISMPVMDGFAATKEIRKYESETGALRTPIICVSAHAFEDQRQKSAESGMDDYLTKPVNKTTLMTMIEKWADAATGARNVA